MAVHDVEIQQPRRVVLNSDVTFIVKSDGERLGELRVSKGSIDWVPAKSRSRRTLTWEEFDQLMRAKG